MAFPDGGECEFVADNFCGPFLSFTALSILLKEILEYFIGLENRKWLHQKVI